MLSAAAGAAGEVEGGKAGGMATGWVQGKATTPVEIYPAFRANNSPNSFSVFSPSPKPKPQPKPLLSPPLPKIPI